MPSLISDAEKQVYESARQDIFDTFSRPFVCYKTPEKIIISSDTNYKFSYSNPDGEGDSDYVEYVPESRIFQACIAYGKDLEQLSANKLGKEGEDIRLTLKDGTIRLKVIKEDWDFLQDAIDYEFDGNHFEKIRVPRPHGLFTPKYYSLTLTFKN